MKQDGNGFSPESILEELSARYPQLKSCEPGIRLAFELMRDTTERDGMILTCGNGGSESDAEHIVGELAKGFRLTRPLQQDTRRLFSGLNSSEGHAVADMLQHGIRALPLAASGPLASAIANDIGNEYVFAQQILAYGRPHDTLICISTSGSSPNVVLAASVARRLDLRVVCLTGRDGGSLKKESDCCICVPEDETYKVQELHLPVYHALCAMLEADRYSNEKRV